MLQRCLFATAASLVVSPLLPAATWTLDSSFAPEVFVSEPAVDSLQIVVQPDGSMLALGDFNRVDGVPHAGGMVRLSADGAWDDTFAPGLPSGVSVFSAAPLSGGRVLILARNDSPWNRDCRLLRLLSDGSIDAGFVPLSLSSELYLLRLPDGGVAAYGSTGTVDGVRHGGLLRFHPDGTRDTAFGAPRASTGSTHRVSAVKGLADGKIYASGYGNESIDGTTEYWFARHNTDGSIDPSFSVPAGHEAVGALLVLPDNSVLVARGLEVARYLSDGTWDESFRLDLPLYPGSDHPAAWVDNLALLPNGNLVAHAYNLPDLSLYDGSVWLFTPQGALIRNLREEVAPEPSTTLLGIASNGDILLGAEMLYFNVGYRRTFARVAPDGTALQTVPVQLIRRTPASIEHAQRDSVGRIVIGGFFDEINGQPRAQLARFTSDGSLDATFAPAIPDSLGARFAFGQSGDRTIVRAAYPGTRYRGQWFTTTERHVRLLADGSVDPTFSPSDQFHPDRWLAEHPDGRLLAASVGNMIQLAWMTADGALAGALPAQLELIEFYSTIRATLLDDGDIGIAGELKAVNGAASLGLVRLNADGTVDPAFSPALEERPLRADFLPDGRVAITGPVRLEGRLQTVHARLLATGELDPSYPILPGVPPEVPCDPETGVPDVNFPTSVTLPDTTVVTIENSVTAPGEALWAIGMNRDDRQYEFRRVLRFHRADVAAITAQPSATTVVTGRKTHLWVTLGTDQPATYQWLHDGVEIAGATGPILTIVDAEAGDAGSYTVRISIGGTTLVSQAGSLAVQALYARLSNFSARSQVRAAQPQIAGFILQSELGAPHPVLLRALGRALNYGGGLAMEHLLPDGRVGLFSGSVEIAADRAGMVRDDIRSLAERLGAFRGPMYPDMFPDINWGSALATTLSDGVYTAHTSSYSGEEGISLFELYDAAETSHVPFVNNVSLRGRTAPGDDTMIGGFIIDGNRPATLLLRVVGPELSTYGVTNALADPQLQLFAGPQTIAFNEDWESDTPTNVQTFIQAQDTTGAFPLPPGSASAGLVIALEPGAYTVHATSANGAAGEVLMEIYVVDP